MKFRTFYENNGGLHFLLHSLFQCQFSFGWYESRMKFKCVFFPLVSCSCIFQLHFSLGIFLVKTGFPCWPQRITMTRLKINIQLNQVNTKETEAIILSTIKHSFEIMWNSWCRVYFPKFLFIRMEFCFVLWLKKKIVSYLNWSIIYWMVESRVFKDGKQNESHCRCSKI